MTKERKTRKIVHEIENKKQKNKTGPQKKYIE
jgi:hypothetical protein